MIGTPGAILTLGLGGSPSLITTLGYGIGAYVEPPAPPIADFLGTAGWGPIRRRKRKDEDEDKPQELPEVVEVVATKPRKTLKLADIIGKRQAAQITSVDLSEAVAASKKRKRQQEDELLLLM